MKKGKLIISELCNVSQNQNVMLNFVCLSKNFSLYICMMNNLNLIGEFDFKKLNKRSIAVPNPLLNQLGSQIEFKCFPIEGCICFNFGSDAEPEFFKSAKSIRWSPSILNIFKKHKIYPSNAFFAEDKSEKSINLFELILDSELYEKELLKIGGHNFEHLISDLLVEYGYCVEMNLRLHQSEIDILACVNKDSNHKILIECKQNGLSGNKVGVSVIHRLFGLQEILKMNNLEIKSSLVVSTTGFTRNSKKIVAQNQLNIDLLKLEELIEWLDYSNPMDDSLYYPLINKGKISNGKIRLDYPLLEYIKEQNLILFAYREVIELWGKDNFDRIMNDGTNIFPEIAAEIFSQENKIKT